MHSAVIQLPPYAFHAALLAYHVADPATVHYPPVHLASPQAGPPDPDNFPFMVLGNKIDENGGSNRQVGCAWS